MKLRRYNNFILEYYGPEEVNILTSFLDLPNISAKLFLPQVGSKRYSFIINNNKIIGAFPQIILDYVVMPNGGFLIGKEHYKMSDKSKFVKAAGEIRIEDGKIIYISNESGHYKTSKLELQSIVNSFNQENLLHPVCKIDAKY